MVFQEDEKNYRKHRMKISLRDWEICRYLQTTSLMRNCITFVAGKSEIYATYCVSFFLENTLKAKGEENTIFRLP